MAKSTNRMRASVRTSLIAAAVVCGVLFISVAVAAYAISEALEERQAATASSDLRLAAYIVADVDVARSVGLEPSLDEVMQAVEVLEGDRDVALHALSSAERAEADRLLDEIAQCGATLLTPGSPHLEPHGHPELQNLLALSSARATADAEEAERIALLALLAAALTVGLAAWLLLRSRTSELQLRRDLFKQANTDLLTGLPNRRALDRALEQAEFVMQSSPGARALVFLDLDGFKDVNDTLGHDVGDNLLIAIADRLREAQDDDHMLVRLGGDEFAVLLNNVAGPFEARSIAECYLNQLEQPFPIGGRIERVHTSIGVTTTTDPEHVSLLTAEADVAMYKAKRAGGHRVVAFEPSMKVAVNVTSGIIRALRAADYDSEFSLSYQPIVDINQMGAVGYEALLRWHSPTLGQVSPADFIPIAEQSGDIQDIGRWVIEAVCKQLHAWDMSDLDPQLSVSCNVSALQLADDEFVPSILDALNRWQVDPGRLVLEVTESAVLDHGGVAVNRLTQLRNAGIRISVDDFGNGYSNLGQLLHIPFDFIKIDRLLLLTLSEMRMKAGCGPEVPCPIMEAIVSIASEFKAPVICEGVETTDQLALLQASGVTHVQGYLTGRPGPPPDMIAGPSGNTVEAATPSLLGA